MGKYSAISWTTHTFNPWWGCFKVSPACAHCYAESSSNRYGFDLWGEKSDRRFFGDNHWNEPISWDREAAALGEKQRVFCASMADVFEDRRDLDDQRTRLWRLTERTPNLIWLLLTKRTQHVLDMVPEHWRTKFPDNVWMGATTENQDRYDATIDTLRQIPARVRFLSVEPMLEKIDLGNPFGIHWVIVGCESGPKARPMELDWVFDMKRQCQRSGVKFFVKQVVENGKLNKISPLIDGVRWNEIPS